MKTLSILLFALTLTGCSTINLNSFSTFEVSDHSGSPKTYRGEINYHGVPLRSGQILVSNNNTPLNFFLTLTDREYHPYAHAGIISIEQGQPYLYHAVAKLTLLARGTLTDKTKGTIARTPLHTYLKDKSVIAIYNLPFARVERPMVDFAMRSHREKLPYDSLFDETDSSKVYCSEFIVRAIESGGGTPVSLRPRSRHPSIDAIYDGLGIESVKHYFVSDIIADASRVALFSKTLSKEQIGLYFAVREELYRRFTPDQKVGNIMRWTGFGLAFREPVKLFMERGVKQDFREQRDDETLREWVAALADEVLGPVSMKTAKLRISSK